MMSATSELTQVYAFARGSVGPVPDLVDIDLDREALRKHLLEALGPSAWEIAGQTFAYRWSGADSFNSGDPVAWILIKMATCVVDMPLYEDPATDSCLMQYDSLRQILDVISSSHLRQLERFYTFPDGSAVHHFLQTYPHLTEFLLEAYPLLREHFGSDLQVVLEIVSDPETADAHELVAQICTSLPVEEALARLDRFDQEWFLGQVARVGGVFNVNLTFL